MANEQKFTPPITPNSIKSSTDDKSFESVQIIRTVRKKSLLNNASKICNSTAQHNKTEQTINSIQSSNLTRSSVITYANGSELKRKSVFEQSFGPTVMSSPVEVSLPADPRLIKSTQFSKILENAKGEGCKRPTSFPQFLVLCPIVARAMIEVA